MIGDGTGLFGLYFSNSNLTGLVATRIDPAVDFDWDYGEPAAGVGAETFSARWTGQVQAQYSGSHTFYTYSDDGVRLWVNNQLLIDQWNDHTPTEHSGTITLTAGQFYDIKLEYYDNTANAVMKLSWSNSFQTKVVIAATQLVDDAPRVSVERIADATEGGSSDTFRFTRTGNLSSSLTVNYTVDGTAESGTDYTALSGTATFAANSATADVTISPTNDATAEFDESVVVSVASGVGYESALAGDAAQLVIVDNETPVVSVTSLYDALEGVQSGFLQFLRTGNTANSLTITIAVGGTATSGTDYTALSTNVTFAAGEYAADVEVEALGDSTFDPNETVTATIASGSGYNIDTAADDAAVTIEDAIPVISVMQISAAYESGSEGGFLFRRTGDLTDELVVDIAISGSATADTDYEAIGTEVTFEAGEDEVYVALIPIDESTVDPGEVVTLTVQTSSEYEVGTEDEATAMIVDDDSPVVTVAKIVDGAEGVKNGVFRFRRTGDTSSSLTVNYTISGTATAGTDYTTLSGSVTFAANEDTVDLTVVVTDDAAGEGTETVIAAVTSGSTYGADPFATAVLSIADEESAAGEIGGVLWGETDGDGIRESGETLLSGHAVSLLDASGNLLLVTVTNSSGEYLFVGLSEGTYYVQVYSHAPDWYTLPNQGSDEALDSDVAPATGLSDPITLTALAMTNLLVGAGQKAVPLGTPAGQATTIKFMAEDVADVGVSGLKVAKWSKAFEADEPNSPRMPRVVGANAPNDNTHDFIDRDKDRFNVYVYDLATWSAMNGGKPANPYITVELSTTNVAGYTTYNDAGTNISLTRINL